MIADLGRIYSTGRIAFMCSDEMNDSVDIIIKRGKYSKYILIIIFRTYNYYSCKNQHMYQRNY
jgi:hypothetical protein